MACDNIYQRCCDRSSVARKKASPADADETSVVIEKLMFIRDYLTDLTAINKGFSLRRAEASPEKPAPATRREAGEVGTGGSVEGPKSVAPKSVAPPSVAPQSQAP